MGRKGQRRKVAKNISNIYEDGTGYSVIVKIRDPRTGKSKPDEHRFPFGTPLEQLEAVRDGLQKKAKARALPRSGSLAADAREYLKTISEKRKLANAVTYCAHWVSYPTGDGDETYGELSRFALTTLKIEQTIAAWLKKGVAASSIKKRLSALSQIFEKNNTDDQPNPVLRITRPKEPDPEPRAQTYRVIERVLAFMPDRGRGKKGEKRPTVNLSKLRMSVMAYAGIPPAQIMRIHPATDLIWDAIDDEGHPQGVLRARPRRKGKGTRESWLPLQPPAVDALKALIEHGGLTAEGAIAPFDPRSFRYAWRRACAKVIREQIAAGETPMPHRVVIVKGKPTFVTTTRPYDLRHSYASNALTQSGGNLKGVQELLQHATSRQTERYVGAAIPAAAAQTAKAMRGTMKPKAKPDGTTNLSG